MNLNFVYAGVGSRKTPEKYLLKMSQISKELDLLGFALRSGGALGADTAFEKSSRKKEIFRAGDATAESFKIASSFHPNWSNLNFFVQSLHARNAMIILGKDLNTPVDFVVCWTPNGKTVGGTGMSISIAKSRNIKIFNIAIDAELEELREFVRKLKEISRQEYTQKLL